MKKLAFVLIAVMLIGGCAGTPAATGPDELDMRLREVSNYLNERIPQGRKIAIISIQSDSQALSEYIIDELMSNAVNDGRFAVVDRQQLDAARAELNFQLSGEVSDDSAQSIGQMLGAQTIITGRVTRVGDNYRLNVRALEVETVQVQGSQNWNIAAGATINALMASGGAGGTAAASGGTAAARASGGRAQQPAPANGTYTFYPRIQATKGGVPTNMYIDRIVVSGNYMTIYTTDVPVGNGNAYNNRFYWPSAQRSIVLQDLDNPRRTWAAINGDDYDNNAGSYVTFQNVTGRRLTLSNSWYDPPTVFDEIILGEPD